MFSEMVYDDVAQLLTGSLADYLVATAPKLTHPPDFHGDAGNNEIARRARNWRRRYHSRGRHYRKRVARTINWKKTGHEFVLFVLPLKPKRVFAACQAAGIA